MPMEKEFYLSIVIPAYKEEKRIHIILDAIIGYVKAKEAPVEIIVVVDASPDRTSDVAKGYEDKLPDLRVIEYKEHKGKGGAVREGVLSAKGKYIVFADADNSTPIEQADKLLAYTNEYDVVIGSRYREGVELAVPQPFLRRIGSRILNIIIQSIAVSGIKDTQCGFKLFECKAAREIFQRQTITYFSFDIEILAIARRLGYSIKEAGITWYDNPRSTVKPIRDGIKMLKDSWHIRKNILAGKYDRRVNG